MTPANECSFFAPALSIVVPCFNEEAVLAHTCRRLAQLRERLLAAGRIAPASELVFVDDGSRDATWNMIDGWVRAGAPVVGVKLSRNCGHQNALLAGLTAAGGDAVVTIDADLQDDESAIERMLDAFQEGNEVVYGVRAGRSSDSWFKRTTARSFYRAMALLGIQTVYDHADYRLLSRRAVAYLARFNEANLFLRGIVPLLGLRSAIVRYDRRERLAGESKYPLKKMLEFAWDGVTSFSTAPLRAIAMLGFALSLLCLLLALWVLGVRLLTASAIPGWASTILPIYFLGGVQLLGVGVLGEYVGKIYMEVKRRPRFLVEHIARAAVASDRPRHRAGPHGVPRPRADMRSSREPAARTPARATAAGTGS